MKQHRIFFKHGKYWPQCKGWFFWCAYKEPSMCGSWSISFSTKVGAMKFLKEGIAQEKKRAQPPAVVWQDGCPS